MLLLSCQHKPPACRQPPSTEELPVHVGVYLCWFSSESIGVNLDCHPGCTVGLEENIALLKEKWEG